MRERNAKTEPLLTAAHLAERLGCSPREVCIEARRHGIGIQLGGRAGWRFTEADYEMLIDALRPCSRQRIRLA